MEGSKAMAMNQWDLFALLGREDDDEGVRSFALEM
jgi:hypothetical protein